MDGYSQSQLSISNCRQSCPICERHFERTEHLKRHLAIHTKDKDRVCRVCGKRFSRKDALDRHQNVHRSDRSRAPLRRFRACMNCASSRVKCSGESPCTRCSKKSMACEFPAGSELRDSRPVEIDPSYQGIATAPPAREQQRQSSPEISAQQQPPAAYAFMQQSIQPVDLMPDDTTTHIFSTLNRISPTMEFDSMLSQFNYTPIDTGDQYWGSPNNIDVPTSRYPSTSQSIRPIEEQQSQLTPGSFPDSNDAETPGNAYVDNTGARRPRNGRYANRIFHETSPGVSVRDRPGVSIEAPEPDGFSFMVPSRPELYAQEYVGTQAIPFTLDQYSSMCQAFQDCCLTPNSVIPLDRPYFSTELPPMSFFTGLLSLYRQHFDPKVLPLVHQSELNGQESYPWVIKLAMSAVGSQYLGTECREVTVALHEFLRRVLTQRDSVTSSGILTGEPLTIAQSKLLNYVGIAYCGSRRLEAHRVPTLNDLVNEYKSLHAAHRTSLSGDTTFQDPREWILAESVRRLYHSIWILEIMARHHFGTQANLLLDCSDVPLPCKEDIWQCEADQLQIPATPPTLERALRVLYVEKRLLKDVGDFSQVLIIHGLYCQIWDVARCFNRPLLRWTPSAQKGNAESYEFTGPLWLPSIPLYNHWRNATCDCLDVLHSIANSDTAKNGTENTTVLHLHFSRIALLAPYESIQRLAELVASGNCDASHSDEGKALVQDLCSKIRRWITDDQYKARLALIHCGVFFWHVRRYSTDAFYEPVKIFLTTLVVWAYGSLCPPQQRTSTTSGHPSGDQDWVSDVDDVSSIRLDRPTDDELVQIYIKRGRFMNATIMGVGNISAPQGPVRMLHEGCKLLDTIDPWFIRHRYLHTLTRLITICDQSREWLPMTTRREETSQRASSR